MNAVDEKIKRTKPLQKDDDLVTGFFLLES